MQYDETYGSVEHYFGAQPERLLKNHYRKVDKSGRVLDLGVGQGRHALFLARKGYSVDAIDPSRVAVEMVSEAAAREHLPIRTYRCGFDAFAPQTDYYSGILIFGLIQILPRPSIRLLLEKVGAWTRAGSIVFVRAFSTQDPSFDRTRRSRRWKSCGKNSFKNGRSHFRTYLESGEILHLFDDYRTIYHWEGLGPEHRHGDGPSERHAEVEAVFQR